MAPKPPLRRGWKPRVRSSVLQILALGHYTFTALLAKVAHSKNRQIRLQGVALLLVGGGRVERSDTSARRLVTC